MKSFKKYKEKFLFYWGQKKYKLSMWGVSPHFDWHITRWVMTALFILSCCFGFVTYSRINTLINEDSSAAFYKKPRVNLQDMQLLIDKFKSHADTFHGAAGQ